MGQRCCKDFFGGDETSDEDCCEPYGSTNASAPLHNPASNYGGGSMAANRTSTNSLYGTASAVGDERRAAHLLSPDPHARPVSPGMRACASHESVGSNGEPDAAPAPCQNPNGRVCKRRAGFFSAFTPRRKKKEPEDFAKAAHKRASGYEMLDRTQVVCLLGVGAFGSVSLVFHRPSAAAQQAAMLASGGPLQGTLAAALNNPLEATPQGSRPMTMHAFSADNLDVLGRATPPIVTPHGAESVKSFDPSTAHSTGVSDPPQLLARHRRAMSTNGQPGGNSRTPPAVIGVSPAGMSQPSMPPAHVSMPARERLALRSVDDIGSLASSQGGSFAFSMSQTMNMPRRVRFSVLKRISKQRQAQMRGTKVDIAAERFRSEGLRHPFVIRLLEASQTPHDYYNVYPFALGGDVGLMLTRRVSQVLNDVTALGSGGDGLASLTKAVAKRSSEPRPAPSRCTCAAYAASRTPSAAASVASPVDRLCPVMDWAVTEGGLPLPMLSLVAFEVLSALQYLATHPSRITHGDIKPENVFISETGHIMLGDFSMMTCDVKPTTSARDLAHAAVAADAAGQPKKRASGLGNKSFGGIFGGSKQHQDSHASNDSVASRSAGGRDTHSPHQGPAAPSVGGGAANDAQRDVERNPRYMPPEVVKGEWKPLDAPNADGVREPVVDMWSFGVMLLEIATGCHPFFPAGTPMHSIPALNNLVNGVYEPIPVPSQPRYPSLPPSATTMEKQRAKSDAEEVFDGVAESLEALNDLISKCLRKDPLKRITASDAQQHRFFRHPLVLGHLGIIPSAVASDTAERLARIGVFASVEEADAALFVKDTDRVNHVALRKDEVLSRAFMDVLWERCVLSESLVPCCVPREACVGGGFVVPEDVNLTLTGNELFASFCNSSVVGPGSTVFVSNHQSAVWAGANVSFSQFESTAPKPRDASAATPPPERENTAGPSTLPPQHHLQQPRNGSFDQLQSPSNQSQTVPPLVSAVKPQPKASTAASPSAPISTSVTPSAGNTNNPSFRLGTCGVNFGDPRMPAFCPVDLRFFAQSQAEFDQWDDEKNKRRLARTDADIRAEDEVKAQLQEELLTKPGTGGGKGGGKGAASGGVAGRVNFTPEQMMNYTYRTFDSTMFR
jgi:serine/threonine protein kinase